MSFVWFVTIWSVMIVSFLWNGATTESTTDLVAGDSAAISAIAENEAAVVKEIGPGGFGAFLPKFNIGALSAIVDFLTWDRAFIPDYLNPVRWFLMAVTAAFTFLFFKEYAGTLATVMDVLGRGIAGIAGGFGSVLRAFIFR